MAEFTEPNLEPVIGGYQCKRGCYCARQKDPLLGCHCICHDGLGSVANETIVELQQENDAAERTIVELRASLDRWTQSWANAIQERDQARRERDKAEQDCQAWAQNYREAQESIGLLHHRIEQLKRGDSDVRQRTRDAIGDYRKPGWRWAWTDLWLAIKTMRAQISEAQNVMDLCVSPESNVAERELAIAQWRAMGSEGE